MITINLEDFLIDGMLKEDHFRNKVESIDWTQYKNQKVIIKGCTSVPVPTWAYLIITSRLAHQSKRIYFGEPCSAVEIYKKN
jgi:hypothetical protein